MLYGFSPAVVRVPDEGPRRRHTTGYWTLPPAQGWTPPADLAKFLAADGPPVVSIGFGSMVGADPAGLAELVRGAARDAGVPVTVVPFTMDQPFWGARVAELGVGPEPIARRRLSRARLAAALRSSVADPGMRGRAAALRHHLSAATAGTALTRV